MGLLIDYLSNPNTTNLELEAAQTSSFPGLPETSGARLQSDMTHFRLA